MDKMGFHIEVNDWSSVFIHGSRHKLKRHFSDQIQQEENGEYISIFYDFLRHRWLSS